MNIFESMENMLNAEQMDKRMEKTELAPGQLETQNAMKEQPPVPAEQTAELTREDILHKAAEEWECFGSSSRLEVMLEEAGIGKQEFQDYHTDRLTEKADAQIESSRELLAESENVSFGRGGMERNDVFLKLEDEHACYGESARFRQIMKENGISQNEWRKYYTGKKNGIGHAHDSPLAREAAYKLKLEQSKPSDSSPSFGESFDARIARHKVESADKNGNKIAVEHRTRDYVKVLEKESKKIN